MNGKQLKNSILQWAIQGKLVPQDPNDEPASELLKRIREEKARLVKEGKIKKDKNESIIFRGDDNSHYEKLANGEVRCIDNEFPFELPKGWEWMRLKNVVFNHGQKIPDKRFSYIDIGSIDNKRQRLNEKENIIEAKNAPSRARKIVEENDIIYSTVRPYLHNLAIIDKEFSEEPIASTGFAVFSCFKGLFNKFLFFYLLSPDFDNYANDGDNAKGVAYPAINDDRLYKALIPIPPFAEQHRIVTKLEELVPFIEKYNMAQTQLNTLNDELNGLLKKSILQEAIRGKLVPQYDSDEPASKLLERIRDEKRKLVKAGKLKAKDIVESIIFKGEDNKYYEKCDKTVTCIEDDLPFDIPTSWEWCRLGDLLYTKTGLAYSKPNLEIKSDNMIRVLRGGNISNGFWTMKSDDVMISSEFVKSDLYLHKGVFITPAVTSWENMGKTALVREDYDNVVVGGFVLMMCPYYIDGSLEEYLNCFFQSVMFQQYCRSITNKSGQAFYNLSRNKLLQMLIPIPPSAEQRRIVAKTNNATASIMSR